MLVLAVVLALVPASGLALCVAESGHVALELVGTACAPGTDADCMSECQDCDDTPLSVATAHKAPTQDGPDAVDVPAFLPQPLTYAIVTPTITRANPSNTASRSPLLRC